MVRPLFGLSLLIVIATSLLAGAYSIRETKVAPHCTIKQVISSPRNINSLVTVTGVFKGWGSKSSPPPVTKSDYVIADAGREIYVTGPLPLGLTRKDIGKTVTLEAKVKTTTLKLAGKKWQIKYLEVW